jgi:hypothetical protein
MASLLAVIEDQLLRASQWPSFEREKNSKNEGIP